jgi:predicted alpha/beta superfamily hydrolase
MQPRSSIIVKEKRQVFLAWIFFLLSFLAPVPASSQGYNPGYELAKKQDLQLYSSVLKETRSIEIVVPPGYRPDSSARYDVIYVLDGIRALHFVAHDYLTGEGFIPKNTILVGLLGIKDTNTRYRDFTPTRLSPGSGGADNFLLFLKAELIPYINKTYPTRPEGNTLAGGSLGGLFVMYALLNEPSLFKSYIALDPSLFWDDGYLNKLAAKKLDRLRGLHRTLWIIGREGQAYRDMGIAVMKSTLQATAPADLTWSCVAYPDETHLTTGFKGFWDGLKFSYGGYYGASGINFKPMNGIIVKGRPFQLWCYNLMASAYIHYTMDDTEPTLASPDIADENTFTFSRDTHITLKSLGARAEYDISARGEFKLGDALSPTPKPEGMRPGGLRFAYYEGEWDELPDFSGLKPTRSGLAGKDFDLSGFPSQKGFACLMEGAIEVKQRGYYIFELGGDGGWKVYLGGHLLLGNHYVSGFGENYMAPLEKGFYNFRVEYLHRKGGNNLEAVYMKQEGKQDIPIPVELLYSRN